MSVLSPGHMFDSGHASRAYCCRASNTLDGYLPHGYMVRHPYIGRVTTVQTPQDAGAVPMYSINWCEADTDIEILDSRTGKSIEG